jgi:hypothetical protein
MQASDNQPQRPELYTLLIAAVAQGWALYGLHWALRNEAWPATDKGWLFALYALAFFTPLTVQLLAGHCRQRVFWVFVGSLALVFTGFGGYHGASVAPELPLGGRGEPPVLPIAALTVLWLMLLPFLQGRLANDRWRTSYREYFELAWHNKLRLAEAGAFTGTFWLLLVLWAALFKLLGITFFRELFSEPLFVYPVTALVFGIALYLIGSQQKLVTVALEQILGLLKWLAVVAALILLLFTLTLLPQLPALFSAGRRALSAHWLLWLVAVMVLLLNAAYRDGSTPQPYPRRLGLALRIVAPLLVIVALTALYALWLRIATLGLTVERAWGLLVALAAVAYSVGYAWAALRPGPWMAAMGRVNVVVALGLIALITLMLTPVLSPWRLSAASQYRVALAAGADDKLRDGSLRYLRFDGGNYGRVRLARLAGIEDHPRAGELRAAAKRMQGMQNSWDPQPLDPDKVLAALQVFPAGRELDPALRAVLGTTAPAAGKPAMSAVPAVCTIGNNRCAGLYIDLDADGREEFVLLMPHVTQVFRHAADTWTHVADGPGTAAPGMDRDRLLGALQRGEVGTQPPQWPDLRIGERSIDLHATTP